MLRVSILLMFLGSVSASADGLERYIEAARKQWQVPALGVGIYYRGAVQKIATFGKAEQETLYAIGEVERGLMAAVVAQWVERGSCTWETPVHETLPQLRLSDPYVARALTLADLFSQRAGFPQDDDFSHTLLMRQTLTQRLAGLRQLPLQSFRYSHQSEGHSALIAEAWLQARAGLPYSSLLRQLVLLPLGMQHADAFPAMSLGDLLLWAECLLQGPTPEHGKVLSAQGKADLFRPRIALARDAALAQPSQTCAFGLSWRLQDYRGRLLAWQNGHWGDERCLFALLPAEGLAVVVLAQDPVHNGHSELPEAVALRCIDHYIAYTGRDWSSERLRRWRAPQTKLAQPKVAAAQPRPDLASFEGVYEHPVYGRWQLRRDGEHLQVHDDLGLTASLSHCYHNCFQLHWSEAGASRKPIFALFIRDSRGQIAQLRVSPDIHWERISEL